MKRRQNRLSRGVRWVLKCSIVSGTGQLSSSKEVREKEMRREKDFFLVTREKIIKK